MIAFSPTDVWFQDSKSGKNIREGSSKNGLYVLDDLKSGSTPNPAYFSSVWLAHLGYPHSKALSILLPNINLDHKGCEACIIGKHCITVYENCFDLIHFDV